MRSIRKVVILRLGHFETTRTREFVKLQLLKPRKMGRGDIWEFASVGLSGKNCKIVHGNMRSLDIWDVGFGNVDIPIC